MSNQLTPRGPSWPIASTVAVPAVRAAAELVELSERLYMTVWALGLRVALVGIGASALSVAFKGTLVHQTRAGLFVTAMFVVILAAARWPVPLYRHLRRAPRETVLFGLAAGAAQWWIGRGSDAVYVVIIVPLGLLGLVCGWRWLLPAAVLAAAGQVLSADRHSDMITVATVATSDLIVPLAFAAIADRLAVFILRLNQSVQADRPPPRRVRATVESDPDKQPVEVHDDDASQVPRLRLTPRQLQAVLLASQGLRHVEIAACLGVTVRQVARLLSQARLRNGCATTGELIAIALAAGIVPAGRRTT